MSHHTSTTLTQIQEPFLVIDDVVGTFELSACYNVTIDCRASDMIATVRTNKLFNGKIYAKDNPNSCVVDIDNKIEFSIKMGYSDIECNVKRKSQGFYSNEVIIQVTCFSNKKHELKKLTFLSFIIFSITTRL